MGPDEQNAMVSGAEIPDLPAAGFPNYWYPLAESRRVNNRPVSVRAFGQDLVIFRSGGKLAALTDRCPHRGAQLSLGRIVFPGTLSCGYHGWTFNQQGECIASIVEGPEAGAPGRVRVKSYPVEERFGIIWAFMGEGEPPPLAEDLPPQALAPNMLPNVLFWEWDCDWRNASENYPDMLHAIWVHRTSLHMVLAPIPVWGKIVMELLPDGKGFSVYHTFGGIQAHYPGLGVFPARYWWRTRLPRIRLGRARGKDHIRGGGEVRMPGYVVLNLHEPFLGFPMLAVQWPYPIDEKRTRVLSLVMTYPKNSLRRSLYRLWFKGYYQYTLRQFVEQDRRLIESQNYRSPERLAATDSALIQWRRFALKSARQARPSPASGREKVASHVQSC